MHTPAVFLLPPPNPERAPNEPVTHLLEALDHIAVTPCSAAQDAEERRQLLYLDAVTHLCATFPTDRQQHVSAHHTTRLMTCSASPEAATADELRVATLAVYGWACDRAARGLRNLGNGTWVDAAQEALETYRTRKNERVINTVSGRSPQVSA